MSVLDPRELEASPLADLHALAAELGLEGFRRLRKAELISQIVVAQGGSIPEPEAPEAEVEVEVEVEAAAADPELELYEEAAPEPDEPATEESVSAALEDQEEDADESPASENDEEETEEEREEDLRSGILDVLPNGSGFIRAEPYRQSREDVYVSPAQIRRCELRPGDEVAGPVRPPRRNERHPSLVRVATVSGQDADAPAERPRFDTVTAQWPTERLAGPSALVDTPFGMGSRVAIGGAPRARARPLVLGGGKVLRGG